MIGLEELPVCPGEDGVKHVTVRGEWSPSPRSRITEIALEDQSKKTMIFQVPWVKIGFSGGSRHLFF